MKEQRICSFAVVCCGLARFKSPDPMPAVPKMTPIVATATLGRHG